jgi:hypothetical protein
VRGIKGFKGAPEELSALLESLRGEARAAEDTPPEPEPAAPGVYSGHVNQNEQEDDHEV